MIIYHHVVLTPAVWHSTLEVVMAFVSPVVHMMGGLLAIN